METKARGRQVINNDLNPYSNTTAKVVLSTQYTLPDKTDYSIVTFEVTCPPWVWWDLLTHRMLSRNANSTRAIPGYKFRSYVASYPGLPANVYKAQKGMVASIKHPDQNLYKQLSLELLNHALEVHEKLEEAGYSKQDINLLLSPWFNFTGVITATEWSNFFALRISPEAKPELRVLALQMYVLYFKTLGKKNIVDKVQELTKLNEFDLDVVTRALAYGEDCTTDKYDFLRDTHIPYVTKEDYFACDGNLNSLAKISTARCARRLVTTGEPVVKSIQDDIGLAKRLAEQKHWSPFEHVAFATYNHNRYDNFTGFRSYRNLINRSNKNGN